MALSLPAAAQVGREEFEALKKDVEALRQQQTARESQADIVRELQEIKNLLRETLSRLGRGPAPATEAPAAPDVVLTITGHPAKGDQKARLVLVDFTDFQ